MYYTVNKLANGNLLVKQDPMNGNLRNKLGVIDTFHDLYIHKNNAKLAAPEGKIYFSIRLSK